MYEYKEAVVYFHLQLPLAVAVATSGGVKFFFASPQHPKRRTDLQRTVGDGAGWAVSSLLSTYLGTGGMSE